MIDLFNKRKVAELGEVVRLYERLVAHKSSLVNTMLAENDAQEEKIRGLLAENGGLKVSLDLANDSLRRWS